MVGIFINTNLNVQLLMNGVTFGIINLLGVLLMYTARESHVVVGFVLGLSLLLFNAWFYMIYCYKHGKELTDKEKCLLGICYIGLLALSNILSDNRLMAQDAVVELTTTGVLLQLVVVPIISCLITVLLCKQDFILREDDWQ